MVFTREKIIRPIRIANDVFSRVRKMIRPISLEATEVCDFRAKITPFIAACSAVSHTFNEKSFTQRVFLAKKSEKHFGNGVE